MKSRMKERQTQEADRRFLCWHALVWLPDSVTGRRRVLRGVLGVLGEFDPVRLAAKRMLVHLDAVEAERRELAADEKQLGQGLENP